MGPELSTVTGSYAPGQGVAIAAHGVWLFVDAPSDNPMVTAVWSRLQEGEDARRCIDVVAEELSAADLAFALVTEVGGAPTLVLGGGVAAEVEITGLSASYECAMALQRVDHRFRRAPSSIRLSCQKGSAAASTLLPLGVGIASASQLLLVAIDAVDEPSGLAGGAANRARMPDVAEIAGGWPPAVSPAPEPPVVPATPSAAEGQVAATALPTTTQDQPAAGAGHGAPALATVVPGASSPDPPDLPSGSEEAPDEDASSEEDGYGFLFGNTVNRSVADAAVQQASDDQEAPPAPVSSPAFEDSLRGADTLLGVPAEAELAVAGLRPPEAPPQAPPEVPLAAKASGIIESVPWAVSGGPPPAPSRPPLPDGTAASPAGEPVPTDDRADLELTMSRQAADALARQVAEQDHPVPPGPTVHAVHCASGHPNPPQADVCRVCGAPVAAQPPVTVPRPVLGFLRFSTGDVIPLDRNVLIGRQPATDRLVEGMRPHVVKVPSPEKDISRNHLEIRLDDWHVLATDLNSTNGTILTRPGRPPERLRPDQATMIEPGTRVSLADDVSFAFEAK